MLIYVLKGVKEFPMIQFESVYNRLPKCLKELNDEFRNEEDKIRHALGKLLIEKGLLEFGLEPNCLNHLVEDEFNRPYLPACNIDFNLSHSGDYIICAFASGNRVGIDIEEISEINLDDFSSAMNEQQWQLIRNSRNPHATFFKFWTIKESMIKADGRGHSISLNDIHVYDDFGIIDGKRWYYFKTEITSFYSAHISVRAKEDIIIKLCTLSKNGQWVS